MGNGTASVWRWGDRARVPANAAVDVDVEPDIVIDLRSGEPEVSLQLDSIQVAPAAVRLTSIPGDGLADVIPLFEEPIPTDASSELTREITSFKLPTRGMLGRAISRTDPQHTVGATYSVLKRVSDLLVSTLLFVLLIPVLVAVAIAVRVTSPGPALYRQQRVGRHGSPFTIFKFRTMSDGADQRLEEMDDLASSGQVNAVDGPVFKAPDDPRITKVGRILRRTNLDELPQLLNILAGHMSLVGPRPLVDEEIETLDPDQVTVRQAARPGVTCLWQVARTNDMTFDERIDLDLFYAKQRSVSLDVALVLSTPVAILRGARSY